MVQTFSEVKRMTYTKKIKDVANQLMLSSHCISHRFQLSMKSAMEKNNRSLKDLFQFLNKLLKYHLKYQLCCCNCFILQNSKKYWP